MTNHPTEDRTRADCPAWCTTAHKHHAHEGLLYALPGACAVTVGSGGTRPVELGVWDQTETPYRPLKLDQADALVLARVLCAIKPEDLVRFAAALAEGARVLDELTEEPQRMRPVEA